MPPPLRKRAASPTDINKHPARAFPMSGKPPGYGSPERNGAVARRCRSGVFRPLPITPMLMCLYGVVSVEDMAAASPQAVRLVSVGKKRVPGNRFPPCGIDGHKQFAAVRRIRRASLPTG